MGSSAGRIDLDLELNQRGFKRQLNGILGTAKKAGLALAAAFSVKKLIDFGASCVKLGSDLDEVQNVVDVTFPRMSAQVDEFAKNAITSFGLSETMAKQFTGTFGAMAKAFGFGERNAYEMSTTLTGLAGDVASFYNLSQEESYTKLKSVFTGETESLKDLGVVMTQSALDAYALANGYGKTTSAMSEMEKVSLRYQFVQEQLSLASGDFIRTSDGWANQVRVLKLQFDSLKATIGQGLINVLTPVIKVINTIIGKLMGLANAFKAFTEMVTGKRSGGGTASASAGMSDVADAADAAGDAVSGTGNAAKKAAKELRGVTTGIDELNIIQAPDASGTGAGAGGYDADTFNMGEADTSVLDEMENKYPKLIDRFRELAGLVKQGFWDGFGDTSVFDSIRNHITGIRASLKDIFTDREVVAAANRFADTSFYNFGKIIGADVSIGASIADNLLGGLDRCLKQNRERIKNYLVSMFNIRTRRAEIYGNFAAAFAEIISVLRGDAAKQVSADLMTIFIDVFMGLTELAENLGADILDLLTAPFIENKDSLKEALEGLLDVMQEVTGTISNTVSDTVDGLLALYGDHIHPLFESLKTGFIEITDVVLKAFQEYILPTLQDVALKFREFDSAVLRPLIDRFLEFSGKVFDALNDLWEALLKPLIIWLVTNVAPVISSIGSAIMDTLFVIASSLADVTNGIITTLSGMIDFIAGIFTGNWRLAWEGIKAIFHGIWETIKAIASGAVNTIESVVQTAWTYISSITEFIWNGIKTLIGNILNAILSAISSILNNIMIEIDAILGKIKANWESIWTAMKEKTIEIFHGIWDGIKGVINTIISGIEKMANSVIQGINSMIKALNRLEFDVPDWAPELGGKSFGLHLATVPQVSIPRLAQGGYVRANTPQLAMIGDNRSYGEIVAPEDKMQEMVDRAVRLASRSDHINDQYLSAMVELLRRIIELIENLDLSVRIDVRDIRDRLNELDSRSGYRLRQV